jgi:hypothetical protein
LILGGLPVVSFAHLNPDFRTGLVEAFEAVLQIFFSLSAAALFEKENKKIYNLG